jgi:Tol biopolymer transport system component
MRAITKLGRIRLAAAIVLGSVALALLVQLIAQEPAPPANQELETRIFVCQPDGSGMKLLVEMTDYRMQGSPAWSQDGKLIAFDAWRPDLGEKNTESKIIVVNADGSAPRILGDGAMPSFSPRHNRVAFTRYQPNYGVWVMSIEGPDKELVLLDDEGWGADWSPDGKQIVYTVFGNEQSNLVVFDLIEGERTLLFEEGKSPYSSFFWNFAWSPDGRYIAFKGQRVEGEKFELGIVDARGAKHGLITRVEGEATPNIGWSHESKRIFFSQKTKERGGRVQIYTVAADNMEPPQLLPGQDPLRANITAALSPDGKQLLIVSRKPPAAKNNPGKGKAKKAG